jgi:hypothetical protein
LASPNPRCDTFTQAGRRERRGQPNLSANLYRPGLGPSDRNHTVALEQDVTPFRPARRRAPVLLQLGMNQRLPDAATRSFPQALQIIARPVFAGRNADGRLPHQREPPACAVGTTGFEPATP